jgi:hypothetical protein
MITSQIIFLEPVPLIAVAHRKCVVVTKVFGLRLTIKGDEDNVTLIVRASQMTYA